MDVEATVLPTRLPRLPASGKNADIACGRRLWLDIPLGRARHLIRNNQGVCIDWHSVPLLGAIPRGGRTAQDDWVTGRSVVCKLNVGLEDVGAVGKAGRGWVIPEEPLSTKARTCDRVWRRPALLTNVMFHFAGHSIIQEASFALDIYHACSGVTLDS
ncbi:hypothetical protein HD554DRAFT_2299340 [Boletus coccyginus]|nr:hypothetical protein HD554DRAFT_2299340 [Boletus coccyginus]